MNKSSNDQAVRKRCFDPVVDHRTRILMLGSLPGEKSLALQQYYGNRQNRFWALMSEVIEADLTALDYASRLHTLLQHGIGLWDVIAEAHRPGSLDSNIRDHNDNDLPGLLAHFPGIACIAFNGGTAQKFGMKILGERTSHYHVIALPSSSPAYTLSYAVKLQRWQILRQHLT